MQVHKHTDVVAPMVVQGQAGVDEPLLSFGQYPWYMRSFRRLWPFRQGPSGRTHLLMVVCGPRSKAKTPPTRMSWLTETTACCQREDGRLPGTKWSGFRSVLGFEAARYKRNREEEAEPERVRQRAERSVERGVHPGVVPGRKDGRDETEEQEQPDSAETKTKGAGEDGEDETIVDLNHRDD